METREYRRRTHVGMVCHLSMNAKIHTFDAHYLMTGVGHELDEYVTKLPRTNSFSDRPSSSSFGSRRFNRLHVTIYHQMSNTFQPDVSSLHLDATSPPAKMSKMDTIRIGFPKPVKRSTSL
ncbi:hypothetical protein DPMN_160023 [Dreissena polymorpha]|uniref:Uncharacterized protein n=1 Tax=Dreissena polymorpha TaxID=45954 RepID=A0A9D4EKR1_DREPO|nr:hypothetical protein DPMN_160023 [Dreissena polymorpha]